jgi:hypothetical protein
MLGYALFMPRSRVQGKPPGRLRAIGHESGNRAGLDRNRLMSDFLHGFAILTWMSFFNSVVCQD